MSRVNTFDLSNYKLMTGDMGILYPVGLHEVLPGDTFVQHSSALIRTQPLYAPVMHPLHAEFWHFFVPLRLIWEDFQDFITGGANGTSVPALPTVSLDTTTGGVSTLADYLGRSPRSSGSWTTNVLPFRAMALIFNEWFRDQDLVTELPISLASGADTTTNISLQRPAWEKDYFTSSRPWASKGNAVVLPLGGTAPITGAGNLAGQNIEFRTAAGGGGSVEALQVQAGAGTPNLVEEANIGGGGVNVNGWRPPITASSIAALLQADLSSATAVDINDLRLALAIQRYQENRARYGSRYTEYLRMLGVRSDDARLQRPELLGRGKTTIQFGEVLQTAEGTDPVGSLAGHGMGVMRSNSYRRYFTEHGYQLTLMAVRPKTMYVDAVPRLWNRTTKEDFWQPELQHVGQQAVLNKEVRAAHATPDGTFSYQDRYDEYRRSESQVAGEFRTSLDFWHLGRKFASDPALNAAFVECNPSNRIFSVSSAHQMQVYIKNHVKARRLLTKEGRSFIL